MISYLIHHLVTVWAVAATTIIVGLVCTFWLVLVAPVAAGILIGVWYRWKRQTGGG